MKLEKSTIEAMFLSERKLLKVPEYLAISMKEYAKVVYDIANVCMLKKNAPYIISCYSREVLPRMFEETCLVADIHYIEFLADFAHWKRLKEKSVIEAIFFKYQLKYFIPMIFKRNGLSRFPFFDCIFCFNCFAFWGK